MQTVDPIEFRVLLLKGYTKIRHEYAKQAEEIFQKYPDKYRQNPAYVEAANKCLNVVAHQDALGANSQISVISMNFLFLYKEETLEIAAEKIAKLIVDGFDILPADMKLKLQD